MFDNSKTKDFIYKFYLGIIFALIFIFGFLIIKEAFGATLTEQTQESNLLQAFTSNHYSVGQSFRPTSSFTGDINIKIRIFRRNFSGSGWGNTYIQLENGWGGSVTATSTLVNYSDVPMQVTGTVSDAKEFTYTFSNLTLTSGSDYTFRFRSTQDNSDIYYVNYKNSDVYANGQAFQCTGTASYNCSSGGLSADLYFKVESVVPPEVNQMTFIYPISSSTIGDFNSYNVRYEVATTTTSNLFVSVYQSTSTPINIDTCVNSTSTPCYKDRAQVFSPFVNSPPYRVPLTQYDAEISRSKHNFLSWYAKAVLEDKDGNTLASSTINYTTVSVLPPLDFETPTSTATSSEWSIDCSGGSIISNSLCYVLKYLFYPSQQSVYNFYDIKAEVENKPPFGYYKAVKDELSEISTSTPLFNFPTGLTTSTSSPFYLFRSGLNWLLWLLFTFWLFHRIRHLEL